MRISVVIPTLDEAARLPETLARLSGRGMEIIVADGGSRDATVELARLNGALLVTVPSGRGAQLREGARRATGDVLLFLHADTFLPDDFDALVEKALARPGASFGAFRLDMRPISPALRLIRLGANARTRIFSLPYGDQAIFVTRSAYEKAGGFAPIPLMEDVDLALRLRKTGRFVLAGGAAATSARRWQKEGVFRAWVRNQVLLWLYLLGASPHDLAPRYRKVR